MNDYDKFSFLITYPMLLLCLVPVADETTRFHEEYLFSQLFGGNWDKMDIAECFSASIVVIALCISIIPFLKKYPLLIGLNKYGYHDMI